MLERRVQVVGTTDRAESLSYSSLVIRPSPNFLTCFAWRLPAKSCSYPMEAADIERDSASRSVRVEA